MWIAIRPGIQITSRAWRMIVAGIQQRTHMHKGIWLSVTVYVEGQQAPAADFADAVKRAVEGPWRIVPHDISSAGPKELLARVYAVEETTVPDAFRGQFPGDHPGGAALIDHGPA